jgi:tRNA(fMet)-specific endonuclease VapC
MILADTDVLIDYLSGTNPVATQVRGYIDSDRLQTSAITNFELLSGVRPGRRGDSVRQFLADIAVLPLDRIAAERAADIRRALDREGRAIGMGDSLIAGIALANDLPLFTRNRNHFERVAGLRLVEVAKT